MAVARKLGKFLIDHRGGMMIYSAMFMALAVGAGSVPIDFSRLKL